MTVQIDADIKQFIFDVAQKMEFGIDTMESDRDHIHILVDIPPKLSAFQVVHQLKQITTFRIYKRHKMVLKKHYWSENIFWSDGYFVCSTGDASTETIRKYIDSQG